VCPTGKYLKERPLGTLRDSYYIHTHHIVTCTGDKQGAQSAGLQCVCVCVCSVCVCMCVFVCVLACACMCVTGVKCKVMCIHHLH